MPMPGSVPRHHAADSTRRQGRDWLESLGMLAASAITVVPGHNAFVGVAMAVCLACSLFFMALAIVFQRRVRRGITMGAFRVGYAVFALVVSIVLLLTVVG